MPIDADYINEFHVHHDCLSQSRSSRVRSGEQEFFQLFNETWLGHQDFESEKITYASLSPLMVKELEFDGRERYEDSGAIEETFRIVIHLRSLESLVRLARLLEYSRLQDFFQLDPLRSLPEDMLLTLNFSEKAVRENADYLDELFAIIGQIETLPLELLSDLKSVVAYNCIERFKRKLATEGFKAATKYLKGNRLRNMLSPHYVAALHCRKLDLLKESRELIQSIQKDHDSYDFGHGLMRSTYEQEIKALNNELTEARSQYAKLKKRIEPVVVPHSKPPQIQPVSASISPLPYVHLSTLTSSLNISKPITFSPRWQSVKQPSKAVSTNASAPRVIKKPN
jgi:hypothetical protein